MRAVPVLPVPIASSAIEYRAGTDRPATTRRSDAQHDRLPGGEVGTPPRPNTDAGIPIIGMLITATTDTTMRHASDRPRGALPASVGLAMSRALT